MGAPAERTVAMVMAATHRIARATARARLAASGAVPLRRTVHRVAPGRRPPPPSAFATFGAGSWVVPEADVRNPDRIRIGARTVLMEHARLWTLDAAGTAGSITIGDDVLLGRFCTLVSAVGIVLEDGVAGGDSVTVLDTWDHPLAPPGQGSPGAPRGGPVVIEEGAYLAFGAVVGPGVRVGRHAYVGEGAVVLDDVPPHTVVFGNPAVVTRRYDPASRAWTGAEWP
jgi:carbonic anhydrase/acetyltransferase-like protein (isoleucine patch superfamily)